MWMRYGVFAKDLPNPPKEGLPHPDPLLKGEGEGIIQKYDKACSDVSFFCLLLPPNLKINHMKKIVLLFVLVSLLFTFTNCKKTADEKAQLCIKEYLEKNLNDIKSYESIEFTKLQLTLDKNGDDCYTITHKFRAKNAIGATTINIVTFIISRDYKIKEVIPIDN